jgi:hypothetical protein
MGFGFIKFSLKSIVRIDIGINAQNLQQKLKQLICRDDLNHIKLFQACIDEKEYKINFIEI